MATTIINYRNMTTVYSAWVVSLISPMLYGVTAYLLQFTTPYMFEKSQTLLYWLIIISVFFTGLSVLFKYVFKQEILAWIFLEVLGICGFILFLVYGWNVWFFSFMAAQFMLLLLLGPYLHFD